MLNITSKIFSLLQILLHLTLCTTRLMVLVAISEHNGRELYYTYTKHFNTVNTYELKK